jgi:internalin A
MGTWGHNSFENDWSLDWIDGLLKSKSKTPVQQAIKNATRRLGPDADVSVAAVAAAEVVAYSRGHGPRDFPDNGMMWVDERGFIASDVLASDAISALENILAESELAELWKETSDRDWKRSVKALLKRLSKPAKALSAAKKSASRLAPKEEKAAIAVIQKAGGDVHFENRKPNALEIGNKPTKKLIEAAAKLTTLHSLWLTSAILKGNNLQPLVELPNVKVVDLQQSNVDSETFKVIANFGTLEELRIRIADFPGAAPKHVSSLKNLTFFEASQTNLNNAGLAAVSNSMKLMFCDVRETRVADDGLERVANATELYSLNLGGTKLSSQGLRHLKGLKKLGELVLSETKVTHARMKHLSGLRNLEILRLDYTDLNSSCLKHLAGMSKLVSLSLTDCSIGNAGMKHLAKLLKIKYLWLGYAAITDAGLQQLAPLRKLDILYLDGTNVKGKGLEALDRWNALSTLSLSETPFSDAGCQHLVKFPKLS